MDKLSQIVSSRGGHYAVDLSKERPLRTGAPSFGQPISHPAHVYEMPEEDQGTGRQNSFSSGDVASPGVEHQKEIVDRINFSFAKKPELPVAAETEELSDEKVHEAISDAQTKTQTLMGEKGNKDSDHKNVNLSIYV